jgi:OTU domain-containing protein 7
VEERMGYIAGGFNTTATSNVSLNAFFYSQREFRNGSSNSNEQIYSSLELIHVFALANVLKRPIIVVADSVLRNASGEAISPIPFGGIFLPLEVSPQQCHRSPLILCYDSSHFSALVAMKQSTTNCLQAVPITDRNRNLLPVHFAVDPGASFNW